MIDAQGVEYRMILEEENSLSRIKCWIEREIGDYYRVYPVMSLKAWEEFHIEGEEGAPTHRAVHHVFGVKAEGVITDLDLCQRLAKMLVDGVKEVWPAGSLVVWRRRPDIEKQTDGDGSSYVRVTIRLGSPATETGRCPWKFFVPDGEGAPIVRLD